MGNIETKILDYYKGIELRKYKSYRGEQGSGYYVVFNNQRIGGVSIGSEEAELISNISKIVEAEYILKIGVAFGFSTVCFALSYPKSKICAIDNFSENNKTNSDFIRNIAINILKQFDNIDLFVGESPGSIKECASSVHCTAFSIVFIDAEHTNFASFNDFQGCLPYLNKKSIVFWHDVDKIKEAFDFSFLYCGLFSNKVELNTWGRLGLYFNIDEHPELFVFLNPLIKT